LKKTQTLGLETKLCLNHHVITLRF